MAGAALEGLTLHLCANCAEAIEPTEEVEVLLSLGPLRLHPACAMAVTASLLRVCMDLILEDEGDE